MTGYEIFQAMTSSLLLVCIGAQWIVVGIFVARSKRLLPRPLRRLLWISAAQLAVALAGGLPAVAKAYPLLPRFVEYAAAAVSFYAVWPYLRKDLVLETPKPAPGGEPEDGKR